GLVVGGGELGADAPDVYPGALVLEAGDDVFVEVVAGEDRGVVQAGGVEDLAGLDAEVGQVAAVQADADHLVAGGLELPAHLGSMADAFYGIVRVDEEDTV